MKATKAPSSRHFKSPKDFEAWLERNHAKETELWVKLAKKGSGISSVTYQEAVDVALCYGWIDGLARSLDETFYLQRFTPRKPKGNWTETNCRKAEAFIAQGRMKPSGLRAIENAKAAGQWKPAAPPGASGKSR
jgi:uncharacterized protein YdeI (YjbR/CyaY-like superfamily)